MICRKCREEGTIVIKKDYIYCKDCYLVNLNHKFRACIGKNKAIYPNENILIALSGGVGSTALVDLIHTGITINTHKKLRIKPQFVHLTGTQRDCNIDLIVKQCKSYGFDVQLINISGYSSSRNLLLDNLTAACTTSNDCISRVIQNALASVARELQCRVIFTAQPATNLAAKLLSDIVIGRGSQIENDIGFMDSRHENIKILRPLCDITEEELRHYIKMKGLIPAQSQTKSYHLQTVIDSFVATLEKESPATISTICKTADKIGSNDGTGNENYCIFCKGKLDKDGKKLTSIQAISFSKMVSSRNKECNVKLEHMGETDEDLNNHPMLPHIQHLCYSCSRTYAEADDPVLKNVILDFGNVLCKQL